MDKLERVYGCLIGGAAGDALGYAVRFMSEEKKIKKYGNAGITGYECCDGISDDTQMTLFTANGVLCGAASGEISQIIPCISASYKDWYRTQTEPFPVTDGQSWLLTVEDLYSQRAPGLTCMDAIKRGAYGTIEHPINQSKGCGGVMRVAPIGLYFAGKDLCMDESDLLGAQAAALTHGHELGYIPAAAFVHIIRILVEDENITVKAAVLDSITAMQKLFPQAKHLREFTEIMQKAVRLAESEQSDPEAVHQLGEGWVAEETLAIAAFCAIRYSDDFEKAIIAAVNHSSNSDSTGAVTGNILGARLGWNAIPHELRYRVVVSNLFSEVAEDICEIKKKYDLIRNLWNGKYKDKDYRIRNGFVSTSSIVRQYLDRPEITRAVIPDGMIDVDYFTFCRCFYLKSIVIPKSVKKDYLFHIPKNVAEILVDEQNPYLICVDGLIYDKTNMTDLLRCPPAMNTKKIVIPEGITYIDDNAFEDCHRLEEIVLPESMETISEDAFIDCISLKFLRIPAKCRYLGEDALVGCESLEEIIIDDDCDFRPDMIEDAYGVGRGFTEEERLKIKIWFRGKVYNYQTYHMAYYSDEWE